MALRTNDLDSLRTLDISPPSLTGGQPFPHDRQTSSSSMSDHSRPSAVGQNEHDPSIDKFSTLFTPSTPRASPTLLPVTLHSSSMFRSQVHSITDDHGSFTSVSAHEDPLSSSMAPSNSSLPVPTTFEWDNDDHELLTTPVLMPVLLPSATSSQPSNQPTHADNASLTFFDKFAQDAKRNSEMRRKGLVDELLKCEDDPLYFLHNRNESAQKKDEEYREDRGDTLDNVKQPTSDPERQASPPVSPPLIDTVLHDLDHEYFSSGRLVPDNDKTPSERRCSISSHNRSPSMPSPPTLAPPFMDSNISLDLHSLSNTASTAVGTSPKSLSSSFSARWMSNLLKTSGGSGHHQQQGHGATQTLESIFGMNSDASSSSSHPPSGTSSPTAVSTVSAIHRRNSSSPPTHYRPIPHSRPHIAHTLPTRIPSSLDVTFKHTASPFGTHAYLPPSGAPGFRGESYDWDKGFSNELEREIVRGRSSDRGNGNSQSSGVDDGGRIPGTQMQAHSKRPNVGVGIGIGAFIEKKTGNLDLKGRRASTDAVLSQNLAILVCDIGPFFHVFQFSTRFSFNV
jgi:hypothetical protein